MRQPVRNETSNGLAYRRHNSYQTPQFSRDSPLSTPELFGPSSPNNFPPNVPRSQSPLGAFTRAEAGERASKLARTRVCVGALSTSPWISAKRPGHYRPADRSTNWPGPESHSARRPEGWPLDLAPPPPATLAPDACGAKIRRQVCKLSSVSSRVR